MEVQEPQEDSDEQAAPVPPQATAKPAEDQGQDSDDACRHRMARIAARIRRQSNHDALLLSLTYDSVEAATLRAQIQVMNYIAEAIEEELK